jgi:hypothetical protein
MKEVSILKKTLVNFPNNFPVGGPPASVWNPILGWKIADKIEKVKSGASMVTSLDRIKPP